MAIDDKADAWQALVDGFLGSRGREIYAQLVKTAGGGPFDGGCVLFAQALQARFGGEIWVLCSKTGAEHALLRHGPYFVDATGPGMIMDMIARLAQCQMRDVEIIGYRLFLDKMDLLDAPRNAEAAQQIAQLLPPALVKTAPAAGDTALEAEAHSRPRI